MALRLCKDLTLSPTRCTHNSQLLLIAGGNVSQVRFKNRRDAPQKKRVNVFVKRHTDLIKHLCIALVKHERVLTTANKALQLQEYGDLLINLIQRKQPPPDLFMIRNGFVTTEDEAIELRIRRRIMNRMSRRIFIPPKELSEDEYIERCRVAVKQILLEDNDALGKLYGTLAERFSGQYGGFTKVTKLPLPKKKLFPNLAYVEYVGNNLQPLPEMPTIIKGRLKAFPRSGIISDQSELMEYN